MRKLILLLTFAVSARADQNPLIARWIEAAGSAAVAKIDPIHRVDNVDDDGMKGSREEWITADLERRERVDHTHDSTLIVYANGQGWRRDWNGFVERLAGTDLERQANLAFVHSFAPMTAPATQIDANTLEFRPKGGSAVRFAFDSATGLPQRATMPSFDGTMTIAFSDWRKIADVLIPFAETWTTGPNTTKSQLQSIEFVARDRVDLHPPEAGPQDTFFLDPKRSSETLPFNFDNNHIFVLATVNGAGPDWFLVDTGANYSVINTSRVAEFHLVPYGGLTTIGGGSASTSGSYVDHVTYRLGDVELRDQHAAVLELRGLEKLYGMPVAGLLGFDFLSRFVTDIDYVNKTLTLRPRSFDTSTIAGATVPLVMQGEQPYFGGSITVRGETIPAWFILDVGAADTITFTTPYVAEHKLIERAGDPQRAVRKFAAPDVEAFNPTNIRGVIDGITFGGITLPHVFVNLSAAKNGAYTSPAFSGNIGETILSRFSHVILDYRRSVMILQTKADTTRPFEERKTFGMSVVSGSPDLHQFTVTAVEPNSPAATAGFQKGDVMASIDGTPAAQMNLAKLRNIFSAEATDHDVVVKRGTSSVSLHVKVVLKPISSLP